MAATDVTRAPASADTNGSRSIGDRARRLVTETKASFKTTELIAYVVILLSLLIAGLVTKAGTDADDRFVANDMWTLVTILTVGYMISRGLAKAGSRQPYTPDTSGAGIGERVQAAGEALRDPGSGGGGAAR